MLEFPFTRWGAVGQRPQVSCEPFATGQGQGGLSLNGLNLLVVVLVLIKVVCHTRFSDILGPDEGLEAESYAPQELEPANARSLFVWESDG